MWNQFSAFLNLRPNCLLTRKPVWVTTSTRPARIYLPLYKWQIGRHGYKIISQKMQPCHEVNIDQIPFLKVIDHLIDCAEKDYLEGV